MDRKTILTKTAKGVMQINQKAASLSRDLTKILKFIDGKSNVDELSQKADLPVPALEKALEQLLKEGFIKVFVTRADPPTGFDDDFDFTAPGKLAPASRTKGPTTTPVARVRDDAVALAAAREKAQAESQGREKAQAEARARVEREAQIRARLEVEVRAKAEAEQRAMVEAKRVQEASERARKDVEARLAAEKVRKDNLSNTHARLTQEQIKKEEEESKALVALRMKAEVEAKALAEARAKAEAEAKMLAEARIQAEAAAKRQGEESALAQRDLRVQLKKEIEATIRQEIEEKLRVDVEEQGRGEVEEAVLAEAKEHARAQLQQRLAEEAVSLARLEANAKQHAEEETKRMLAEQEVRLRAEMEQRIKAETESLQRASLEAKIRAEKETQERVELEERLKVEADARARAERDSLERQEAEARNRQRLEARARDEAADRARVEAEMKARLELEQRGKREAEARAKLEAEGRQRHEAEASAQLEAERRARGEAEKKAEMEAKARAIAVKAASEQAEAKSKIVAEAEGRIEVERKARERAEAKSREQDEAEERDRQEQVARLKRLAEQAERNQQEKEAQGAVEEFQPRARRKKKRSVSYWIRWALVAVVGILVLGLVLIQVVPLGALTTKVQKGLSAWLHDDVTVTGVRIALFPNPRLKVDGVSVGKFLDAKASSGEILLDISTLFDDRLAIDSLELQGVTISREALARIGQWSNPEGRPANVRVERIVLKGLKLDVKDLALEPIDADLKFSKGVLQRAAVKSSDGKWSLDAKRDGDNWQFDLNARTFVLPVGTPLPLDDVKAKGTLSVSGQEIVVPEFEAGFLNGNVNGSLRADWKSGVNVSAESTVKKVNLAKLFDFYTRDIQINGRMEGAFSITSSAPTIGELLKSPHIQGNFAVKDGSVSNLDLVQAMRSPDSAGRGGATKYTELVGALQINAGEIRYSKLKMAGGVLSASGDVAVLANEALTGRLVVEIRSSVAQDRGSFAISGTVAKPQLRRGN
jgi:AsmA-like C-terminal region